MVRSAAPRGADARANGSVPADRSAGACWPTSPIFLFRDCWIGAVGRTMLAGDEVDVRLVGAAAGERSELRGRSDKAARRICSPWSQSPSLFIHCGAARRAPRRTKGNKAIVSQSPFATEEPDSKERLKGYFALMGMCEVRLARTNADEVQCRFLMTIFRCKSWVNAMQATAEEMK